MVKRLGGRRTVVGRRQRSVGGRRIGSANGGRDCRSLDAIRIPQSIVGPAAVRLVFRHLLRGSPSASRPAVYSRPRCHPLRNPPSKVRLGAVRLRARRLKWGPPPSTTGLAAQLHRLSIDRATFLEGFQVHFYYAIVI